MPEESTGLDATLRGLRPSAVVFDRYELLRVLGRGGMGVVWQARDHRLELDVALKFLPEGIVDDAQALDDLKRETRRCRELAHEHIVRVHDLEHSATAAIAAISMECVVGQTLKAIKDAAPDRCLDPETILPWVRQLADALTYAHERKKVVHRDLKPANLMIGEDGALKVMDFGIARSIAETHGRTLGGAGGSSGTPAYMSPEQIRGDVKPSASDDVYAFGATLYDLLTSRPPFFRGDAHSIMFQAMQQPPTGLNARREELGIAGREPIPAAWEKMILACLAKEPADRPASIAAALDLLFAPPPAPPAQSQAEATLPAPAPVPPPTPRRSRGGLVLAGIAIVLLAGGAAWWLLSPPRSRPVAGGSVSTPTVREIPRIVPATPAPAVAMATSHPATPAPATPPPTPAPPTASERATTLLAQAGKERDELQFSAALATAKKAAEVPGLDQAPETRERAQFLLAQSQLENGDAQSAITTWRSLIAARTERLGADHAETLAARFELVDALSSRSDYPEALAEAEAILKSRQRLLGEEHPDTLRSRTQFIGAETLVDRFAIRLTELKELLERQRKILPVDDPALAETLWGLARQYLMTLDHAQSEAHVREALTLHQRISGPEHPKTLRLRRSLAIVMNTAGQPDAALAEDQAVLAIYDRLFQPEHPSILATRSDLADIAVRQTRYDDALTQARDLLPTCQRVLGPDANTTLSIRRTLALALWGKQQLDDAHQELLAVRDLAIQRYGATSPLAMLNHTELARLLRARKRNDEAVTFYQESLATAQRALPDPHVLTGDLAYQFGTFLNELQRSAEAEEPLNLACEIRSRLFGPGSIYALTAQLDLSVSLISQEKYTLAATLLRPSLMRSEETLGEKHLTTLKIANNLGFALSKIGKADEARSYYERVVKAGRETLPADDPNRKIWEANLSGLTKPAPAKKKAK